MNMKEHLLVTLAEEALEVAHACSKALRFGTDDGYPGTDRTNVGDIEEELIELDAVRYMCRQAGIIKNSPTKSHIHPSFFRKIKRVEQFMKYAKDRGALEQGVTLRIPDFLRRGND